MSKVEYGSGMTPNQFIERVEAESRVKDGIRTETTGHKELFDDTGHLSKMGEIAARIANGDVAWNTNDGTDLKAAELLKQERTGTPEDDYEAAVAEQFDRNEEAAGRVAGTVLEDAPFTKDARRIAAARAQESVSGGSLYDQTFPDARPKDGSEQDMRMASELPGAVGSVVENAYFAPKAEQAVRQALRTELNTEANAGLMARAARLVSKRQSRTDRVIKRVADNAHYAGVRANEAGDAVRSEQEQKKAAERNVNPFE